MHQNELRDIFFLIRVSDCLSIPRYVDKYDTETLLNSSGFSFIKLR